MTPLPLPMDDLLADYILGLLEGDNLAQLEAALASDPALQAALAEYQAVTDGLALALPQRQPPARLEAKLMAQIAPKRVEEGSPPTTAIRWRYYAAAIAALMLLVLGVTLFLNFHAEPDPIAQVLQDKGRSEMAIVGQGDSPVRGKLVLDRRYENAVLQLQDLPTLDPQQAYQIWFIGDNDMLWSAAIFRNEDTTQNVHFRLPNNFRAGVQAIGMTIEPAGGSQTPTTPPIVVVAME